MSYSFPSSYASSSGLGLGLSVGTGYSYSALTSSMDPGEGLDAHAHAHSPARRSSHSAARPEKRKPPSPRHRLGGHSSIYKSLGAGLTLPETNITKATLRAKTTAMETLSTKPHPDRHPHAAPARPHSSARKPFSPQRTRQPAATRHRAAPAPKTDDAQAQSSRRHSLNCAGSRSTSRPRTAAGGSRRSDSRKSNGGRKPSFAWGCFS